MIKQISIILMLTLSLFWGCESISDPGADNPLDPNPDNPGYVQPDVTLVSGPGDAETVNSADVTFILRLNETAIDFTWQIDENEWCDWQSDSVVKITFLDEGSHLFNYKARNSVGIEGNHYQTHFNIDAVTGPALRFFPRKVTVPPNTDFTVEIYTEEVTGLAGLTIDVLKSDVISLVDYQVYSEPDNRTFLGKNAGVLFVPEINTSESMLKVALMRTGQPAAVTGTGAILSLTLRYNGTGDTQMSLSSNCVMLDSTMQAIAINTLVPLKIVREETP